MTSVLGRRFGPPAVAAVSVTLTAMLLSLGGAGYAANGPSAKANGNEFCDPLTEFDSDDFEDSAEIDKKVYTLEPARSSRCGERSPRKPRPSAMPRRPLSTPIF